MVRHGIKVCESQTRPLRICSPTASQGRFYIKAIKVRLSGWRIYRHIEKAIPPDKILIPLLSCLSKILLNRVRNVMRVCVCLTQQMVSHPPSTATSHTF